MHDACRAIGRGELDVVLVTGAEAMYTRALACRRPDGAPLAWADPPAEATPAPVVFGVDKPGASDLEMQRGVAAARARLSVVRERPPRRPRLDAGRARGAHRRAVVPFQRGRGGQPLRVDQDGRGRRTRSSPRAPTTAWSPFPTRSCAPPTCRWTRAPATSCAPPRPPGPPGCPRTAGSSRWPVPTGNDHWYISNRPELDRSPAIRLAGAAALELAGLGIDDVGLRGPLLVLPRGRADGGARARPARRRSRPAPDADRRPHLRRRAREQLHVPRDRPGRRARCGRRRARRRS